MARSRNIKPGFFQNEVLADMPALVRLLFAGLWTIADREGRLEDRPRRIKAALMPYDDLDVSTALDTLAAPNDPFVVRYEVDGAKYIQITKWHDHQKPHHMEAPSVIPPMLGDANKFNHSPVTKVQRERILERDGRKCVHCGSDEKPHIDHKVPVSKGGTSEDSNLQVLCEKCNCSKNNRDEPSTSRQRVEDESCTTSAPVKGIRNQESVKGKGNQEGAKSSRFVIPTIDEVAAYAAEKDYKRVDADRFWNFYQSKGWKVGKAPMKDWKAAVCNWEHNSDSRGSPPSSARATTRDGSEILSLRDC